MKKTFTLSAILCLVGALNALAGAPAGTPGNPPSFPSLEAQLKSAHVKAGSNLEKLIRDNQDFHGLTARDAADTIVPAWLKIY